MQMIDKEKLLDHMLKKHNAFSRELAATSDVTRREMIRGQWNLLEWYMQQIASGTFDIKEDIEPCR